jgi:ElaB/YqjD/DUF883 family membrane-anchored ribosome-binding protein
MKLKEQLLQRRALQVREQDYLTPRARAELAKQRLRTAMNEMTARSEVRRRPYLWLGVALGAGVVLGMYPQARRKALKVMPLVKSALNFLR